MSLFMVHCVEEMRLYCTVLSDRELLWLLCCAFNWWYFFAKKCRGHFWL